MSKNARQSQFSISKGFGITVLILLVVFAIVFSNVTGSPISGDATSGVFNLLPMIFLWGGLYFLPSIIGRKKKNATAILVLNFFLGWTLIGWIAALVWAFTKD